MTSRFGEFELDPSVFELRRQGELVPIQRRAFDLLRYLVEHADVVVTKAELLEHVWSDVVVAKDALPQAMMAVRNALGDDADAPRFVHTVRGRGYRFVASVATEGHQASAKPAPHAAPDAPPDGALVGREAILTSLESLRTSGRGALVLVSGGAGLGKTRVLEELVRRAKGTPPVLVRCFAVAEGAPPLWTLAQVFRALAGRGVSVGEAGALLASGTDLSERLASAGSRFRLLEEAASALFAASRTAGGLVLLLDDVHRADGHTTALLAHLARGAATAPLVVVATQAPSSSVDPAAASALAALSAEPGVTGLTLAPLSREELASLLASLVGHVVPEVVLAKVHEKTGGNPRFVRQVAHVLRAGGELRADAPGTSALLGGEDMHAAILHHIGTLPAAVARTLTVAAVLGGEFGVAPVAAVLASENAAVLADLEVAEKARVIARAAVGRYHFTYPLVPDVLRRALPSSERAGLHALAASALEAQLGGASADHRRVGDIARHLVEAAPAGDATRAVAWSLRAAELALAEGDAASASVYARRGLEALACAQSPSAADRARLVAFVAS